MMIKGVTKETKQRYS